MRWPETPCPWCPRVKAGRPGPCFSQQARTWHLCEAERDGRSHHTALLSGAVEPIRVPAPEPPLPPLRDRVRNALGAARDVAAGALQGGPVLADAATAQARLAVCHACPEWRPSDGRCAACGCYGQAKAALAASACPLGRWPR